MGSQTGGFETRPYTSSRLADNTSSRLADNKKIPRMFVNLFVRHNTRSLRRRNPASDVGAGFKPARARTALPADTGS